MPRIISCTDPTPSVSSAGQCHQGWRRFESSGLWLRWPKPWGVELFSIRAPRRARNPSRFPCRHSPVGWSGDPLGQSRIFGHDSFKCRCAKGQLWWEQACGVARCGATKQHATDELTLRRAVVPYRPTLRVESASQIAMMKLLPGCVEISKACSESRTRSSVLQHRTVEIIARPLLPARR